MIVGSILLAFGIDAAWTERRERVEEWEELARIYQELESGGRPNPLSQGRSMSAAAEVVRLIEGIAPGATHVEVPDTILRSLISVPTFETRTPVLSALRQSGGISIIQDREIRALIAAWQSAITNASEWELRARAFVDAQVVPALSKRGDVGRVMMSTRGASGAFDLDPGGVTSLHTDFELKALVSQRYGNAAMARRGLEQVGAAVDTLMTAIQAFLVQ